MLPYMAVIFHICLFAKFAAGYNDCRVSSSYSDHNLTGHVIQTLIHKTFESCIYSCELDPQCFSVNYISLHKTCQLNNATKKYFPGEFVKQKGTVYMDMVVRSYNPCASMRCENGGTCVSSPSVKCKCVDGYSGLHCENRALGMESGEIPDGSIQASTTRSIYDAWKGRLNGNSCWMPSSLDSNEYIKVNFATKVDIVAIATQGSPLNACWVTSYRIRYSADHVITYEAQPYLANFDQNSTVTNTFSPPRTADWLSIYPATWDSCIALRFELYRN